MMTGYPSSGKTTWASRLKEELEVKVRASQILGRNLSVTIINDENLGINKEAYREARSEKAARGSLFSGVERLLSKDTIVICDGLNYIKGFRYQLACTAKALSTPHCLVSYRLFSDLSDAMRGAYRLSYRSE